MRTTLLLSLSFGALAPACSAMIDMDHIAYRDSLISTPGFGVMQVFGDFPDFSGTVVDDFKASGSVVPFAKAAFELSNSSMNLNNIKGWRVSLWKSVADAATSGNDLSGNTVATTVAGGVYTEIFGTGAVGRTFEVDCAVNLNVTAGNVYWIGMAPLLDFTNNGQTFILSNTNPAILGNGTANNSVGVNPGNGFGLGTSIPVNTNAAYALAVPEPATLAALGAGLALLARRRSC